MHLIVDNDATHKHPKVQTWLGRHPRFHFHFSPTSASWLDAVEGFFAKLTRQRLKRGVFNGIVDLQAAINRYLAETNQDAPRSYHPRVRSTICTTESMTGTSTRTPTTVASAAPD